MNQKKETEPKYYNDVINHLDNANNYRHVVSDPYRNGKFAFWSNTYVAAVRAGSSADEAGELADDALSDFDIALETLAANADWESEAKTNALIAAREAASRATKSSRVDGEAPHPKPMHT